MAEEPDDHPDSGCGVYEFDNNAEHSIRRSGYYTLIGDDATSMEPIEAAWTARIHPDDVEKFLAEKTRLLGKTREGGERIDSITYRVRHTDGRWIWVCDHSLITSDGKGGFRRIGCVRDITQEREAQAALRRSEERFRLVAAATQGAIYDHDLVNRTTTRCGNYLNILGLAPEDVPTPIDPLVHPDDVRQRRTLIDSVRLGSDTSFSVAHRLRHADGHWVHVENHGVVVRDAAGRATRITGSLIDVSARVAAEASLRRSETRMRLAQEAAGIGMFELDFVEQKRTWSPEMFRMLGLPADSPTPGWHEGAKYYTEEYSKDSLVNSLNAEKIDEDPSFRRERTAIDRQTGKLKHLLLLGKVKYDAAGKPLSVVGLQVDITDMREAEQNLRRDDELRRLGFSAALAGIWDRDIATRTVYWSAETFALFDRDIAAGPPGFDAWPEIIHPEDRDRVLAAVGQVLAGREGRFRHEYRTNRRDGAERWVLSVGSVERDAGGAPLRLCGIVIDITERRLAEERQALLAREVSHRAKNALAVVASIVRFTRAETVAEFRVSLEQRIAAMGRAHALLADQSWHGVPLEALLRGELAAYSDHERCTLAGPAVTVVPAQAQAISLIFHEFTTNAAKYGALAQPGGRLAITWEVLPDHSLRLTWSEDGCSGVAEPARNGFGTRLIETTIRHQVEGSLAAEWRPTGVCYRLSFGGRAFAPPMDLPFPPG